METKHEKLVRLIALKEATERQMYVLKELLQSTEKKIKDIGDDIVSLQNELNLLNPPKKINFNGTIGYIDRNRCASIFQNQKEDGNEKD